MGLFDCEENQALSTYATGRATEAEMTRPRTTAARHRALIIALVLCVHGLMALPLPRPVMRQNSPSSVQELSNWRDRLADAGVRLTNEQLVDWVRWWSQPTLWRRELLAPMRPLHDLMGVGQGWGFFAVPVTHPRRLEVYAIDGDTERLIYRRLDPRHSWRAAWFSDRHVRGVYDSIRGRKPTYRRFVATVAEMAFEDFPNADEVRVQLVRSRTPHPRQDVDVEETKVLMDITIARPESL